MNKNFWVVILFSIVLNSCGGGTYISAGAVDKSKNETSVLVVRGVTIEEFDYVNIIGTPKKVIIAPGYHSFEFSAYDVGSYEVSYLICKCIFEVEPGITYITINPNVYSKNSTPEPLQILNKATGEVIGTYDFTKR